MKPGRLFRLGFRLAGGLLVLLVVAGIGGWFWLQGSLPRTTGTILVNGPEATVEVLRDGNGVPHIFAGSAADAWYAIGFVHAQDRLWQMEMLRRIPAGRVAEIVGEQGLRLDRFMRTLGIGAMIGETFRRLPAETRAALTAYADGVNGFLETREGPLPPEFVLLRHQPEPWRPEDSLLWGAAMSLQLSGNWQTELLRARLSRRLSTEQIADLWPAYPAEGPVTMERRTEIFRALPLDRLQAALPPEAARVSASNAWVLGGHRTTTGAPVLANDPHLGFTAPGLWYLMRVVTPEMTLAGAWVPGMPFLVLGHNGRVAWGFTTTNLDAQDLFIERLDPGDPTRYLTPEGSEPFRLRREVIRLRDGSEQIMMIRETRHGPVLDDLLVEENRIAGEGHVLALAAAFLTPDNSTADALRRMNLAGDAAEFAEAARGWLGPQQNMVHADTAGNIGMISPALIPIRRNGTGDMPAPGWDGSHDWTGFVPAAELPYILNPPAGTIVNANNPIVDDSYPWFITSDWEEPWRARRIHEMLANEPRVSPGLTAGMQADTISGAARALLPLLLDMLPAEARDEPAAVLLRDWDRAMAADRPEPLIFTAWAAVLTDSIFADEMGESYGPWRRIRPRVLLRTLNGEGEWCDDTGTPDTVEDCAIQVAGSLDDALRLLRTRLGGDPEDWRWDDLHQAKFRHRFLDNVPVVRGFATITVPTGGGDYTVSRGTTDLNDPENPFVHVHGAGYRAVYDLADLEASLFIVATGQSGNLLSPRYDDMTEGWLRNDRLRLTGSAGELEAAGAERLRLVPDPDAAD